MNFLMAHPQSKHYSQKCTSQQRPIDLCLLSLVPSGQLVLTQSSFCSPVDMSAKQAAQVIFPPHGLLEGYVEAVLGVHLVSNQQSECPDQCLYSILQMQKKKCCWQVILRKVSRGSCNLPYPHGSGIAEHDESSLLTVHHKTRSEILFPKLCI